MTEVAAPPECPRGRFRRWLFECDSTKRREVTRPSARPTAGQPSREGRHRQIAYKITESGTHHQRIIGSTLNGAKSKTAGGGYKKIARLTVVRSVELPFEIEGPASQEALCGSQIQGEVCAPLLPQLVEIQKQLGITRSHQPSDNRQ